MSQIIELAGLSGSGKTALSYKVIRYFKDRGFSVVGRDRDVLERYFRKYPPETKGFTWNILRKYFMHIPYLFKNTLVDTFYVVSLINLVCRFQAHNAELFRMIMEGVEDNYNSEEQRSSTIKMIYEAFSYYQIIEELYGSRDDKTIVVMDEGFCRLGRMVYARGDIQTMDNVAVFAARIPRPDLVIHVEADISTCLNRLKQRYRSSEPNTDNSYSSIKTLENGRLFLSSICEEMKNKDVPVLKIDNNSYIESSTESLKMGLDDYLKKYTK